MEFRSISWLVHWWENGALVTDELETADHSYRDRLIELHRAAEAGAAGADGS